VSFSHPLLLLVLLAAPLAWLAYRRQDARARRFAVRFPAASSLAKAAPAVPAWRKHLPAALAVAAIAPLAIALSKPHHTVSVAIEKASIVLVTDHSGSMQAQDVQPTRLGAAVQAAHAFVDKLPTTLQLGVVAYSGGTDAVQAPSADHDLTLRVVDGQVADGATATGDALATALALLHRDKSGAPSAIVLLSDGATTAGVEPVPVAAQAGRRTKIPIYTVALGTDNATLPNPDPFGPPLDVSPDPATLREIARVSGAQAFQAGDREALNGIYERLGSRLGTRKTQRELTSGFAVAGLLLLLAAGVASQVRVRRVA
jgi:Ca-activated chloride channel family protein